MITRIIKVLICIGCWLLLCNIIPNEFGKSRKEYINIIRSPICKDYVNGQTHYNVVLVAGELLLKHDLTAVIIVINFLL